MKISKSNLKKCKKIKLVLSDVDGVLTDGGMYYSELGESMKKFNTKDGMAVELLSKIGIPTIFITRENSKIVKKRAKKVKVLKVFLGIKNKEAILPKILREYEVKSEEIAYLGDDINDIQIMRKVGFSVSPKDAIKKVKLSCDYIAECKGGEGVLRELADIIISS